LWGTLLIARWEPIPDFAVQDRSKPPLHLAKHLISQHVVTGFPEQRLQYLSERIRDAAAQYCAILQSRTYALIGLVRFSDVAASPETATRIFGDLMSPPPRCRVQDLDPVAKVLDLLEGDPQEIAVVRVSGEFVGLITPESFIRWLLAVAPPIELGLGKIPQNSRWHPYPERSGEAMETRGAG